jgi:hypothetical protein
MTAVSQEMPEFLLNLSSLVKMPLLLFSVRPAKMLDLPVLVLQFKSNASGEVGELINLAMPYMGCGAKGLPF